MPDARGRMRIPLGVAHLDAEISEDGWTCSDPKFAASLNAAFPVGGGAVGDPTVMAFERAVAGLEAEVLLAPEALPIPDGAVC